MLSDGSYAFSPPCVPTQMVPLLSSYTHSMLSSESELVSEGLFRNTTISYPSNRFRPFCVPNHIYPLLSCKMQFTDACESPLSPPMRVNFASCEKQRSANSKE